MSARVLFVVADAVFFCSHRLPLAVAARERGYEVHVATPPSPLVERIRSHGLEWHRIIVGRASGNPVKEMLAVPDLFRLYRRVRPDVVHHVAIKPVLYGTLAARLARVPAVVNAVTGMGYAFGDIQRKRLIGRALSFAFGAFVRHPRLFFIFQNDEDRAEFLANRWADPKRTAVIRGSGVDAARFTQTGSAPSEPPLVLLASRLLYSKGVVEFVEAAKRLRERGIVARFAVVGEPDRANPDRIPDHLLEQWRASGDVEVWGQRSDMPDVLRQTAIFCLPTYYPEGVPKALLEAAACGVPSVTTNRPGCRDVVIDGENGLLIPPHDVAALTEALARLLTDHELRDRMGMKARDMVVPRFTIERVNEATLAIYEDLLDYRPALDDGRRDQTRG